MQAAHLVHPAHAGAAARPAPLRLVVVTETYPPEINGVALTLEHLVKGMAARGHEVHLVRPRQAGDQAAVAALGRGVTPAPHLPHAVASEWLVGGAPIPMYRHLRVGLPAPGVIMQRLRQLRPDAVHVATEGPLGLAAVRAARELGIVVTSDFRTNFHAYTQHYGAAWLRRPVLAYLRRFHNRTAVTMVPTEALRAQLQAEGFENLAVVARGVDLAHFDRLHRSAELRRSWDADDDDPVVLHVGRLAAEKNLGLLARCFRAIQARQPRARLVLVGDGPQREKLLQELPEAVFAGQRRGMDLAAHYASADLFLFPSLTETFGNVTVEAMASGLPVVAFDYAAAAHVIRPGRSGMLVARGNEAQFEQAALALAASPAYRRELGLQARLDASRLAWPAVLARFEHTLVRALGSANPGHSGAAAQPAQTMSGVSAA